MHLASMLRVCSVMVLKKLGDGLSKEFHEVIQYLGREQNLQVVVEPHEYDKMVCCTAACTCKCTQSQTKKQIACVVEAQLKLKVC